MDTFDTSEEVMSEIDIQATEVDFGENFEYGSNDQEHENDNEQEAGIGGENGEKNIEDEKLEEKEETLSGFISANRGGSEEFKLEYEGTFVLSTLTEEQKSAQADLLTSLSANPEQAMMLPDYVEGKTTFFTAAKMDNEGNLKYEIRSFTQKEEEKEEKPIDKVEGTKLEEVTLNLELNIDIDKQEELNKETLVGQSLLTEVVGITETEQSLKDTHEHQSEGGVVSSEPLVIAIEDKTEKVLTLEDRIRELFRVEVEPAEIVSEQVQTFEVQNAQQEEIVADVNKTTEININTETVARAEITLPSTHDTEISEPIVNEIINSTTERSAVSNEQVEHVVADVEEVENQAENIHETVQVTHIENIQQQRTEEEEIFNVSMVPLNTTTEIRLEEATAEKTQGMSKTETILSEVVNETHVAEAKDIKSESNVVQEVVVNNIQTQGIEKTETAPFMVDNHKSETQNIRSINIENTKEEKADQNKESPVNVIKSEEKIVVETKEREINPKTEKIDNTKPEKITTERIIAERRIQNKEEKPAKVILNNDKESKIVNTREDKIVVKEAKPEKIQVSNIKTEKEVRNNVLPFKTRESKVTPKGVEVKSTRPVVVEKIVAKNQEERTPKSSREAIVLTINRSKVNNTSRSELPISLEKRKEEQRTREESTKAKPLDGHEILLQILGLSQSGAEVRNAEPSNSRLVPSINQEEQETKSTKSIPSIYQQRNLNGITLKIAA